MPETHGAPLASSPEVHRRLVGDRLLIAALAALALLAALYITGSIGSDAVSGGDPGPRAVLLIADLRGQALVVVDLERAGSPTRIAVPGGPHELVLLDDGRVVTSLEQQGALAVVDLDQGSVEIIEVGGLPHGLAVSDGLLYVTDRSIGAVRRLRVDGWAELSPLPAGAAPHAVRALPGGELVIVSAGDDAVRIGDRLLRVSALPETVALSPDGAFVATASALGGDLDLFAVDGTLLMHVALGGRPVRVVFSPSGGQIAVALSANAAVALVDMRGAVRTVPVPGVPDGLAFDATGRFLFVSDLTQGGVSVIDLAAGRVTGRIAAGESAGALLALAR